MIRLERVSVEKLHDYRATRLDALKETPLAFGSTYEKESTFTDLQWLERIARNRSDRACVYLAYDGDLPCGIAGAFVESDPTVATLFSMWVAPTHRRHGVGKLLVDECIAWCRSRNLLRLDLLVTDWNAGAIAFYQRLGFSMTGKTEPYANDARYVEFEMAMTLKADPPM